MRLTGAGLAAALCVLCGAAGAGAAAPGHPQIQVGGFPTGIALDPRSDTIYVGNGTTNSVSVIDGQTCNAQDSAGCAQRVRSSPTGGVDPIGIGVDEASKIVYVVEALGGMSAASARACAGGEPGGCRFATAAASVGALPQFIAVDDRTQTLYVADSDSDTVAVIDARRCDGVPRAGCARVRATVRVGLGPVALALDEQSGMVYVTDAGSLTDPVHTVSVFDGATCNASDLGGCARAPRTVEVGAGPGGIAVDAATDTVYVTGESAGTVTVIDGKTCNAQVARGCAAPLQVRAGAGARGVAVDEATDTVYVANTLADSVSVIDGATCNATAHSGCGQHAPAAPVGLSPRRVAIDELTDTVYVTNADSDTVTMLDGETCNGRTHAGCGHAALLPAAGGGTTTTAPSEPYVAQVRQAG